MSGKKKAPVESYGGAGRDDYGGGDTGRGADDETDAEAELSASIDGGTSGASSAIDEGKQRRAASGGSGSVEIGDDGSLAAKRSA